MPEEWLFSDFCRGISRARLKFSGNWQHVMNLVVEPDFGSGRCRIDNGFFRVRANGGGDEQMERKMEKLRKFLVCVKNSPEKKTPLFAFREGFRARMG